MPVLPRSTTTEPANPGFGSETQLLLRSLRVTGLVTRNGSKKGFQSQVLWGDQGGANQLGTLRENFLLLPAGLQFIGGMLSLQFIGPSV